MKICHVCKAEVPDELELCPVCGADLTCENGGLKGEEEGTVIENPVLAVKVEDIVTAEIFADVLRDNQIPFSNGETEQNMKIVFGGGFVAEEFYVAEENLERAKELFDEVLQSEPSFDDFEDFDEE
jgi:hypothetical protein